MTRGAIGLAATMMIACGGSPAATGKPGAVSFDARDMRTVLVLYRDGAYVRQQRRVDLRAGSNAVTFRGVARTIVPGTAQFRSLSRAGTRALSWRYWPGRATTTEILSELIGKPVVVSTQAGDQAGTLMAAYPDSLVVDTGPSTGMRMIPRPVEVRGRYGSANAPVTEPRIVWMVSADQPGTQTLEAAYAVTGISWSVGYTLVLDPKPSRTGWLQGWLSVSNQTGTDLREARAIVVDGKLTPEVPPPVAAPVSPGETPPAVPAPAKQPPVRITPLATRIAISAGEERQFSLLGEGARQVPAAVMKVYDPIGRKLDRAGKKPLAARTYGVTDDEAVHIYVDLDLRAAGISSELPAGQVRVYERGSRGELAPLGTTRAFAPQGQPASATEAGAELAAASDDVTSRKARLAIGVAPQLSGKRRQTDHSYSEETKRLVEEFRIVVRNQSESATHALVREHLYRGLNWALAFHNDVGRIAKTGPQEIEFDVEVPAKGKVEIMYRVVYTW